MQPIFVSSQPTKSLGYTTLMGVQPLAKDMFVSSTFGLTGLYYSYGCTTLRKSLSW